MYRQFTKLKLLETELLKKTQTNKQTNKQQKQTKQNPKKKKK